MAGHLAQFQECKAPDSHLFATDVISGRSFSAKPQTFINSMIFTFRLPLSQRALNSSSQESQMNCTLLEGGNFRQHKIINQYAAVYVKRAHRDTVLYKKRRKWVTKENRMKKAIVGL